MNFLFLDLFLQKILAMLDEALFLILSLVLSSSDPLFSRSHSQPDVDLSRPPEIKLHHQANLSVPTGTDTSPKEYENIIASDF